MIAAGRVEAGRPATEVGCDHQQWGFGNADRTSWFWRSFGDRDRDRDGAQGPLQARSASRSWVPVLPAPAAVGVERLTRMVARPAKRAPAGTWWRW